MVEASASDRLVPSVDSIVIGAVYHSCWFGEGGCLPQLLVWGGCCLPQLLVWGGWLFTTVVVGLWRVLFTTVVGLGRVLFTAVVVYLLLSQQVHDVV